MQAFVSCPDCSGPAEITERFRLPSMDGPVDHIALSCAAGHHFRMAADGLPAQQPQPLGLERLAGVLTRWPPGRRDRRVSAPVAPAVRGPAAAAWWCWHGRVLLRPEDDPGSRGAC